MLLASFAFHNAALAQLKSITVAAEAKLDSLDPTLYTQITANNLAMNIGDPLVALDKGRVVGVLAKSWEIVSGDTYVLHLREGVRFHDGTELTSADVKFTLDRILDPKTRSALAPYIALIKSVEETGRYTVTIRLSKSQVTFLQYLTRGIVIISKAAFESMGADAFGQKPVATGPFKIQSWNRTSEWVLAANENYWQGRPAIDRATFRVIPEISTQLAGLLSGELDIAAFGYESADLIARSRTARVEAVTGLYQEMMVINTNRPPFNDIRVRKALNHAVDVDGLIASVYRGRGQRTAQPYTSDVFGYEPSLKPYAYNPAEAKRLLAEAGYPNGFTAQLVFPASGGAIGTLGRAAEVIAANLGAVGIKVNLISPDSVEHSRQVYSDGTMANLGMAQLINRIGDADFACSLYFDSNRRAHFFRAPALDDLLTKQLQETDPDKRLPILKQIGKFLHEQVPWVYLAEVPLLYGVSNRLEWRARPDQVVQLYGARVVK